MTTLKESSNRVHEFAKNELCKPKAEMAKLYRKYSALKSKLDSLDFDESSREREISFLQYEIEEIQNASLSVGEDELLEAKYNGFFVFGT